MTNYLLEKANELQDNITQLKILKRWFDSLTKSEGGLFNISIKANILGHCMETKSPLIDYKEIPPCDYSFIVVAILEEIAKKEKEFQNLKE